MPRPPGPKQRRYRGRIRDDMRSAQHHLKNLAAWNTRYLAKPLDYYPNQLAPASEMTVLQVCLVQIGYWIDAAGAIPSRP